MNGHLSKPIVMDEVLTSSTSPLILQLYSRRIRGDVLCHLNGELKYLPHFTEKIRTEILRSNESIFLSKHPFTLYFIAYEEQHGVHDELEQRCKSGAGIGGEVVDRRD